MNKMLDDWYEDLGRQDRYRERFEIKRRRGLQDLGDLSKMTRYEAHQLLDDWYDEYETELKAKRLGDVYDW